MQPETRCAVSGGQVHIAYQVLGDKPRDLVMGMASESHS